MSDMSYKELYLTQSPLIVSPDEKSDPVANIFGVPFDSTHSYKPGCRFGPDVIRDAFNNIEIFHPNLQVDLETVNIKDFGNIQHTVVATEMLDMVEKTMCKNKTFLRGRTRYYLVIVSLIKRSFNTRFIRWRETCCGRCFQPYHFDFFPVLYGGVCPLSRYWCAVQS